ncbi:MAG: translation initiation factor IF-2 [Prevotella sp.]|nr:translation initiation factor IF-2 [Prevotella sp.]
MSIRLNKALSELNIGLQTAVEFLEKRSELGEVKPELSFKLSDKQYTALVEAFKQDKEVRTQAEKLLQKKPKEKKRTAEQGNDHAAERPVRTPQQYKPLGKIDLDSIGKKPANKGAVAQNVNDKPKAQTAAVSQEPAKVNNTAAEKPAVKEANKPAEAPKKVEEVVATAKTAEEVKVAEKPVTAQKAAEPAAPAAPKAAETPALTAEQKSADQRTPLEQKHLAQQQKSDDIFTTKSEKKMLNAPKVNVLGKIDLATLNQSTRPKKKSKEEKRKEREEKAQQQRDGKKKRERINKVRVDINAAANQQGNNRGGNNNGGGNSAGGNGGAGNGKKKKNRNRAPKPVEVSDEDVARQVKETLARLTNKQNQNKKGAKYRKEKREAVQEKLNEERREEKKESKILKLTEFVTVSELATMMNISVNQVIGTLMSVGIMVSINQRLDAETINLVAEEFGFKTEYVSAEVQEAITEEADDENDLVPRAPIVTVMGHVDHGKTSLLDYIRKTNVIAGEAGGITQHIGAYNVKLEDGRRITFLDTPGHEAFTAMRARGAQVTDIAIIIVAADDAVMPTTKEAIAHAQAANVPMVFAINKIDKPGANPDRVREELAAMNLLVEEWGGKYQCQEISAKKGIGIKELLEKVLLEAEMLDLKANPNRKATGSIIESSLDKGRGYVSTVLVSNGTLRVGDNVIAGTSWGRIKAMFNERNARIEKAGPAEPAIILGLNGAPTAGDSFHVLETEQEARDIANKRLQLQREQSLRTQKRLTLSDISHRIALGSFKELNIIVKGDTDGSVEALSDSFIKLSTEKIKVNVIFKAVGQISESDVTLADASDAIIVGFQVRPSAAARKQADQAGVEINTYSVIYDAIDDVTSAMEGMLDKVKKEVITGQVEVREVYKISKVGTVAGCMVTEGKVHRADRARVVRDGIVVHTADIAALKRYKDDVKEVATNFECGISLVNFNDIQVGDVLETFTEIEVKQTL